MLLLYRGESFDSNFFYHSGVDIDHSFLLVNGRRKILLTSVMNESIAKASFRGKVLVYKDLMKSLSSFIKGKTVLCDGTSLSMRMSEQLGKICHLKDDSLRLFQARAEKKKNEIADVRKAVRLTKEIFDSIDFKSAQTELDIQKQLMVSTVERGLEQAFDPIVATDKNSSYPHYYASSKKIGSIVLVDYGVRWNHYCADLTRCFILDNDKKKKDQYESLKNICHCITDELPKLEKGKDVAELSSKLIEKAGFPPLIHSIGHGVGLDIHEFPRLGFKSEDKLKNSALAIEPAFYFSGKYGMRFEETIFFDGKKARIL